MTGLRKISGNNKHSVVLSSDIKEASFVTQTLTSHHVCNRGGFFCLQISSHSRIMRARTVRLHSLRQVSERRAEGWSIPPTCVGRVRRSESRFHRISLPEGFGS